MWSICQSGPGGEQKTHSDGILKKCKGGLSTEQDQGIWGGVSRCPGPETLGSHCHHGAEEGWEGNSVTGACESWSHRRGPACRICSLEGCSSTRQGGRCPNQGISRPEPSAVKNRTENESHGWGREGQAEKNQHNVRERAHIQTRKCNSTRTPAHHRKTPSTQHSFQRCVRSFLLIWL